MYLGTTVTNRNCIKIRGKSTHEIQVNIQFWISSHPRLVPKSVKFGPIRDYIKSTIWRPYGKFRNILLHLRWWIVSPTSTPKLENHSLWAVRDCLFNIFANTFKIGRPSSPIGHSRRRESHRKQMQVISPSLLEWNHAAITWCVYRCRGVQSLNAD
jgi:hypothetical protein